MPSGKLFAFIGACIFCVGPVKAEPTTAGFIAAAKFMYGAYQALKPIVDASPPIGAPAQPTVPALVENTTPQQISFEVESKGCDTTQVVLNPGQSRELACGQGGEGIKSWYNVAYRDRRFTIYGARYYAFVIANSGQFELIDYTRSAAQYMEQ